MPVTFLDYSEQPLYEIKANLFKAFAHPARIRVLEVLASSGHPTSVGEILIDANIERPSSPSTLQCSSATMWCAVNVSAKRSTTS